MILTLSNPARQFDNTHVNKSMHSYITYDSSIICTFIFLSFSFLATAQSRTSSAYSPRPIQQRRYLVPPEMDSKNSFEGVSRTTPQSDGNT